MQTKGKMMMVVTMNVGMKGLAVATSRKQGWKRTMKKNSKNLNSRASHLPHLALSLKAAQPTKLARFLKSFLLSPASK